MTVGYHALLAAGAGDGRRASVCLQAPGIDEAAAVVAADLHHLRLAQMRRRLRQLAGDDQTARQLDEQISGWTQTVPETAISVG